ncbi:MAG TPA: sigma 54-interacting transcriptional regulator [Acidobacteriota bacterium]|nr:sigma 54-interacting transcriptional regulator [Acidobacteriota bacterium]
MSRFSPSEQRFLQDVSDLVYCNPFSSKRTQLERRALGQEWADEGRFWSMEVDDPNRPRRNAWRIHEKIERRLDVWREAALHAQTGSRERRLYQDAVLHLLYYRYSGLFWEAAFGSRNQEPDRWHFYRDFEDDWKKLLGDLVANLPLGMGAAHIFALFFQIHRAFFHIFRRIIGNSPGAADLRAAVWESIFTCDLRRYRNSLFDRMGQFAALITGPSGTGKDLVAQAIGLSRFLPFDSRRQTFPDQNKGLYLAINLAALSPALIESELFGHCKGAFTGALNDRRGRLESCPARGCIFLDEIGDLDGEIQVKLLRVIENRAFQRVGESTDREFKGKLIAATNVDLAEAIERGQFREDLYFRLCSDRIAMPSLADQLGQEPELLEELVSYMARRVAGEASQDLVAQSVSWIRSNLGDDYPWPGNFRELDQCVRNILIRGRYLPLRLSRNPREGFQRRFESCRLSAEEVLKHYCTLTYSKTGSYSAAARRLSLDRRTVKAKIDPKLLKSLS